MRILSSALLALILLTTGQARASIEYNLIDSSSFLEILRREKPVAIVDIQKKNDYLRHHFSGTTPTDAYPVKTEQDRQRLAPVITLMKKSSEPVVIVGPRGTRAARRAYAYLLEQGIAARRLAILEHGVRGWPAPEMMLNTYGQ